jgi:hypothetical protein
MPLDNTATDCASGDVDTLAIEMKLSLERKLAVADFN